MRKTVRAIIFTAFISIIPINCFANGDNEATKFIEDNIDQIFTAITDKTSSVDEKDKKLIAIFESIVDVKWMARFAMGSQWAALDAAQQDSYIKAYKNYLLKMYLPKFEKNHSKEYKILSIEDNNNGEFMAHLLIRQGSDAAKVKLDYRIKCSSGKCLIRDLIVEDISLVASQRADFSSVINNKGFNGLLDSLEQKGSA